MEAYTVAGIDAVNVDKVWHVVRPIVERALEFSRGEIWAVDIYRALLARDMQLWVVGDERFNIVAAVVTEIVIYPRKKALRVVAVAGDGMEFWKDGWETIELWARRQDCTLVEAYGRPGWARATKEFGIVKHCDFIGKELFPLSLQ